MKKRFLLAYLLVMPLFSVAQTPAYLDTNGLVAYYAFDEAHNTNDQYVHEYHAINSGAVLTDDRFGQARSAYYFDGVSAEIKSPVNQTGSYQYTISAWFKTVDGGAIVCGWTGDNDRGATLAIHNIYTGSDRPGVGVFRADGAWYISGKLTNQSYNDNQWHHIAGVWSGPTNTTAIYENDFTIYIDGSYVPQTNEIVGTRYKAPLVSTNGILIGNHIRPWNAHFHGSIDDIVLYNRALSEREVAQLYKASSRPNKDTLILPKKKTIVKAPLVYKVINPSPSNIKISIPKDTLASIVVTDSSGKKAIELSGEKVFYKDSYFGDYQIKISVKRKKNKVFFRRRSNF